MAISEMITSCIPPSAAVAAKRASLTPIFSEVWAKTFAEVRAAAANAASLRVRIIGHLLKEACDPEDLRRRERPTVEVA